MAEASGEPGRQRRAVVTGGAGFIGSSLCDRLLSDGWSVLAIDSMDDFLYDPAVKARNLREAGRSPAFELREIDTTQAAPLLKAIGDFRPNVVFDLAARAGVRPSIADPASYIAPNVVGLQNTISATAAAGARLVFASSSSIYGDDDRRPFTEDQARGRPESPYGATKIAGEALTFAHHRTTGLPVGIARLFTVFGPRQRPDLAIHSFARRILQSQPVVLFDNGEGVRDYTYVSDVVDALVRLGSVDQPCTTVNVGSGRPIATSKVIDELERALGMAATRQFAPPQPGDVPATHADVSRARSVLGWSPEISFSEGIDRFCAWLRTDGAETESGAQRPD